jgi:hypothetical protein
MFRVISRLSLIAGPAVLIFAVFSTDGVQLAALIVGGVLSLLGTIFHFVGKYVLAPLDTTDLIGDPARGVAPQGLAATAKILSSRATAMRINKRYPVVAIGLSVSLHGKPPYETETRAVFRNYDLSGLPIGSEVPVRVDARDRRRVALDAGRASWLQNVLV